MDDNQFSQAVLLAAKGGLGVYSARLLALTVFIASAVGAKNALSETFVLKHVDGTYDDALKHGHRKTSSLKKSKWLRKMKSKKFGQSQFLIAKMQT